LVSLAIDCVALFDGRRTFQSVPGDTEPSALTQRRRRSIPPVQLARELPRNTRFGAAFDCVEFVIDVQTFLYPALPTTGLKKLLITAQISCTDAISSPG
jgi:hypothetical protein